MINICSFILHVILNLQTCFLKKTLAFQIKATLFFICSYFKFTSIIFNHAPYSRSVAKKRLETTGLDPHLCPASRIIYCRVKMYSLIKDKIPNFNTRRKSFLAVALTEDYLSGKQQNFILF